jgi:nucleotide-binding universal stress UspA family protein
MPKSVLVGLDGTPHSRAAADLAFRWAAGFGTTVAGLGVVDEPGVCAPAMAPIGGESFKERRDEVLLARARGRVEEWLDEFCRRAGGLPVRGYKVVGDPREQLVAESQRSDLLVLGRETYFKFATQAEPCDTLRQVLKDSPRPVVAVPENPTAGHSTMVAYDGSLQAARAAYAFQASGLAVAGPVHVVTVGTDRRSPNGRLNSSRPTGSRRRFTSSRRPAPPRPFFSPPRPGSTPD